MTQPPQDEPVPAQVRVSPEALARAAEIRAAAGLPPEPDPEPIEARGASDG